MDYKTDICLYSQLALMYTYCPKQFLVYIILTPPPFFGSETLFFHSNFLALKTSNRDTSYIHSIYMEPSNIRLEVFSTGKIAWKKYAPLPPYSMIFVGPPGPRGQNICAVLHASKRKQLQQNNYHWSVNQMHFNFQQWRMFQNFSFPPKLM